MIKLINFWWFTLIEWSHYLYHQKRNGVIKYSILSDYFQSAMVENRAIPLTKHGLGRIRTKKSSDWKFYFPWPGNLTIWCWNQIHFDNELNLITTAKFNCILQGVLFPGICRFILLWYYFIFQKLHEIYQSNCLIVFSILYTLRFQLKIAGRYCYLAWPFRML